MTDIDKLQARREKLMTRLVNTRWGDPGDAERLELIHDLRQHTAEMLWLLRNGQPEEPEQAESANAHDELWRQIRTLQQRILPLEQASVKHENTWRYCDRLSAFVMDLEARLHKLEQRDEEAAARARVRGPAAVRVRFVE